MTLYEKYKEDITKAKSKSWISEADFHYNINESVVIKQSYLNAIDCMIENIDIDYENELNSPHTTIHSQSYITAKIEELVEQRKLIEEYE